MNEIAWPKLFQMFLEALMAVLLIGYGYLLGRKSIVNPKDQPEKKLFKFRKKDIPEPEGDLFNDAMKGKEPERVKTV